MYPVNHILRLLALVSVLAVPGQVAAATLIDQVGVDDDVNDNAVDEVFQVFGESSSWDHNYVSGITSITSAILEIDIMHPGGVAGSPLQMFIDGVSLGDSGVDRSGADILHTFDLVALGLTGLLDGSNTLTLAPYLDNLYRVDYSRLTIAGNVPAVPEPGVLALLGMGLLGMAYGRGRRAV